MIVHYDPEILWPTPRQPSCLILFDLDIIDYSSQRKLINNQQAQLRMLGSADATSYPKIPHPKRQPALHTAAVLDFLNSSLASILEMWISNTGTSTPAIASRTA